MVGEDEIGNGGVCAGLDDHIGAFQPVRGGRGGESKRYEFKNSNVSFHFEVRV